MDEIKIINKQIMKISIELLFSIIIFVLALGVWMNPNTTMAKFASSNENQTVTLEEVNKLKLENIYPIDDDVAINENEKALFNIKNQSNVNSKYSIIYRIYSSSTLDYNFLKYYLNIDDKEYVESFSNIQSDNNNKYIDFVLYNGEIGGNSTKTFEYTMWLDKNVGNEAQNKVLSSEFVIKSYGTEISIR